MDKEITDIFIKLLEECGSTDVAEAEFKRRLADDPELKENYNEWCHIHGYSFRHGFLDFCDEYLDHKNSVWDSLTDYDDE